MTTPSLVPIDALDQELSGEFPVVLGIVATGGSTTDPDPVSRVLSQSEVQISVRRTAHASGATRRGCLFLSAGRWHSAERQSDAVALARCNDPVAMLLEWVGSPGRDRPLDYAAYLGAVVETQRLVRVLDYDCSASVRAQSLISVGVPDPAGRAMADVLDRLEYRTSIVVTRRAAQTDLRAGRRELALPRRIAVFSGADGQLLAVTDGTESAERTTLGLCSADRLRQVLAALVTDALAAERGLVGHGWI